MSYSGSCHCGAVAFTVEGELPGKAMSCNCSHCRRKGFLWHFLPGAQFALVKGEEALQDYLFYKHKIRHRYCKICGTAASAEGEQDGTPIRAVNLRCVPECALEALEIVTVDGASF